MSEPRTDSHIYTRMTTESSKSSLSKQASRSGGSYVEIKSGLTNDDYIAFPYGVREGEKTKVSEDGMY